MPEPVLTLAWPRELFVWESRNLLALERTTAWPKAVARLLSEALVDSDAADSYRNATGHDSPGREHLEFAETWLLDLLADPSRLRPYTAPVYWAERHNAPPTPRADGNATTLAHDFVGVILELAEIGYFPRVLPFDCVDSWEQRPDILSPELRAATRELIAWPIPEAGLSGLSESALYSMMEYFHDQAQRPRSAFYHSWNQCGWHPDDFNAESGGVVYRWRVNQLLEQRGNELRLGSVGDEKGRLVHHFGSTLDELVSSQVAARTGDPDDEVAHAIRLYRERGANQPQKRAALALLAGELEPRRLELRALASDAESDLFQIANRYAVRHRNPAQLTDYGEEFLDWIFWSQLAAIELLDRLDQRRD